MFTLAKCSPEIHFDIDVYKRLGERVASYGGRVLLIYSQSSLDNSSIETIKDEFKKHKITFIQSAVSSDFVNREELELIQERAENFFVSIVIAIGDFNQRMCGRFLSQRLSLKYFEIPTTLHNTSLLCPISVYSNRVGSSYELMHIADNRLLSIELDPSLIRNYDEMDRKLELISILFDLAQLFSNEENNIVSKNESLHLFTRLFSDLKEVRLAPEEIMISSLTAMMYMGASTSCEMSLTYSSLLIAKRFDLDHRVIQAVFLPHIINSRFEELSIEVRDCFDQLKLPKRLADLNITRTQLQEICPNIESVQNVFENTF